ncbi:ABC transporter permease [Winogradskyella immobilis]|uniref:ABC transporter permease n=1 Tax=Winogradskyella immobilis TaxID=2816852 RepID=A0ABS8ELM4_9FLAO|nr:FtsX-like permease family protein [Winogradskyella immobilis]MCC1484111.1 ABC transporter permease [Winogradskyella immobilis]MCG0016203.1 ABC transporter permease [Winogradskyella immobilis]
MNFELFIAKRIIGNKAYKNSVSAPIIKIGIAAIAIGIVVMLIAIATGLGLQQKIREKVSAFNGHIIIDNYDTNVSDESQIPLSLDQDFYPEFTSVEGIRHVQGTASKFGVIRTEVNTEGIVIKGVGSDYDWRYFKDFLVEGRLPDFTEKLNNEILISRYIAKRLEFKVDDKFQVVFADDLQSIPRIIQFKIAGIYNSGFQELDEKFCLVHLGHIQRLNRWKKDEVGNFEVFIDDFSEIEIKGNEVYEYIPSLMNATTIIQKYRPVFEWIKIFDNNTSGIIAIMILVAGINMITALLVLILERTQMIGVLKALGSSNWTIRKVFLYNASYLVGLGLLWGNIIGISLLFIQNQFGLVKFPNPEQYYISKIPIYISLDYILLLNIGTFIICMLMLIVPSVIISKISPVKAMRFD